MAVRPTWINVSVDGKVNDIGTGPRAKDGGMTVQFYIRTAGSSKKSFRVECYSDGETVMIEVRDHEGIVVATDYAPYNPDSFD